MRVSVPVRMGGRDGCRLLYVDADTIQVGVGRLTINGILFSRAAAFSITFANLDTGTRGVGKDYFVYAVPGTSRRFDVVISLSASGPTGYSAYRLLGYFHNGKASDGAATGDIFQYSVCSNDLIIPDTPYIAHSDLPAGVPLPGMVRCGGFAIGIYAASRADATAAAAGTSVVPRSQYRVVPWASIQGFEANAVAAAAGCRLPTIWEWWMAAHHRPGSSTLVALQNGNTANTNPPSSSDDATQTAELDPSGVGNRALVGTGPRTSEFVNAAGRSWYSPIGCADMVGNVWEWVAHLAAGLYSGVGYGSFQDWGYGDGDGVWNVDSYGYQPQKGGWVVGLPTMALLGGSWADGSYAGVRSVSLNSSPGYSDASFGFRLAR